MVASIKISSAFYYYIYDFEQERDRKALHGNTIVKYNNKWRKVWWLSSADSQKKTSFYLRKYFESFKCVS